MSKVITFFGADSQTGTSLTAMSVCEELSARGKRPLLIPVSSEVDEGYFEETPKSDLGVLLRLDTIEKTDVLNCIVAGTDYDYVEPVKDPLLKQYFEADLLENFVRLIGKDYEYILIDGGHDVSLPLNVGALTVADQRYYVFTSGPKCLKRFQTSYSIVIEGLKLEEKNANDKIILNRDSSRNSAYQLDDLSKIVGMEGYRIPDVGMLKEAMESDGTTAYKRGNNEYIAAIKLITDDIVGEKKKK